MLPNIAYQISLPGEEEETSKKSAWRLRQETRRSSNVTDITEARRRRLTPTGRALLGMWEFAGHFSPHGPEAPSEELLEQMLALPPPDRAELV